MGRGSWRGRCSWGVLECMPPLLLVDDDADVVGVWRARAELAEARAERAGERLAEALVRIDKLSAQVAMLSRMLFGQSSEQAQRRARPGSADEPEAGCPPAGGGDQKRPRGQQPGSRGHGRRDYTHLATEEVVLDVPADARCCAECGIEFECVDAEASEQIDWRVTVTRIVYRRPRYRRRCGCPGPRSVIAPPAANVVPKGRFTPGFLARLLYDKYVLGLPLHRIVRGLAADGLEVSEGTLTGAMRLAWARLQPLVKAIAGYNKTAGHLHADETSWRVFADTPGKDGHKWWLWVFCAAGSVVFVMDPTRSAAVLESHLGIDRTDGKLPDGRQLVLSTDFYVAYQSLARMDGVHPLWCWAHIRRYFLRAADGDKQLRYWTDAWIRRISDLYLAHRNLATAALGSVRHAEANTAFAQALQVMDTARTEEAQIYSLRPAAKKVLATLEREWDGLVAHRDFPDIDLDNNVAERALRTPVVGRKNFYGSQADWAAHLAAGVWTITATAERNGREPLAYLTEYLNACATAGGNAPQDHDLDRFLPWKPDPHDPTGSRDHDPPLSTTTAPDPSAPP
ncbi:MAG TPA: IS66 family transposase [Micromonosporaceae bacterium]|nr:IS66 family transposase [Micromonosporaceae bacterium]